MDRKTTVIAALMILVAGLAAAGDDTRWVNVHVAEHTEGANIEVHLPLNLVLSVLRSVDVDSFHHGHVDLDVGHGDMKVDWAGIFAAVKDAPDGEFVTVDAPDAKVNVRKQGGTLLIDVTEIEGDNAKVKVTLPMQFMDALSVDENSRIDIAGLLASFDAFPNGDIVTVESSDADVRVWIE